MPRVAVPLTNLAPNSSIADVAGTAVVVADGSSITLGSTPVEEVLIRLTNTNGSDRVATIKAGTTPPALEAGQGDLAITVPATSGVRLVTLSSGRFLQADGTISIDFAASYAGTVTAYKMPRNL